MNRTNRNGKEGIWNEKRIELMSEVNVNRLTSNTIYINRKFDSVVINGSKFNICYDLSEYYKLNIDPLISKKKDEFIDITSYLKYLHAHYPHLLFTSEESKKEFLDEDIPKLMELNEWYTEDCMYNWDGGYVGTLPSQIETYKMLAKVIVTGDTSYYKPTIKPNTHWSNW